MKLNKITAAAAAALASVALTTACSGSESNSKTLTWWATNQGASVDSDATIYNTELAKFEASSGIKVSVEVIPYKDLYAKITSAVTSGKQPDVVSIGNTWASSLQSTGAFTSFDDSAIKDLGGASRFLPSSFAATGAAGKAPTAVPLFAQAYGLFYNKAMFAAAGVKPPKTWQELTAAAKKLTNPRKGIYGLSFPGASYTTAVHMAFIFGRQYGATPFDSNGKPTFATDQQVNGIKQLTDLWADGYVNPSDVQFSATSQSAQAFAAGHAGMIMAQTSQSATLIKSGMSLDKVGVVPIPTPSPLPAGGAKVSSFAGGADISIFKDSSKQDAGKQLIKFLTTDAEQAALCKAFGLLPVVKTVPAGAVGEASFYKVFQNVLTTSADTLPRVADEGDYETNVGNAVVDLVRQTVSGGSPDAAKIKSALTAAQQKMR